MSEAVGIIVEKRNEEKEIVWEVTDILAAAKTENQIISPQFSFADISWHLQLYPALKAGIVNLILWKEELCCTDSLEYNLGFKKLDGSIGYFKNGSIEGNCNWSGNYLFKLSKVQQGNAVIIVCTLKRSATSSDQARMMAFPEHNKLIKLDTLSENFGSIFINKDSCDTTLLVMDKEYKAHKTVLMARSTVFAAMFQHDTSEKQTGVVTIPDCEPESFEKFLEFLYTGKLEELSSQNALHLFETSDKYDVPDLKAFCAECLIHNLTVEHFFDIVIIADKYDDSKLSSAAQDFFTENVKEILRTSEWDALVRNNYRLSKKLLEEMLKVKVV